MSPQPQQTDHRMMYHHSQSERVMNPNQRHTSRRDRHRKSHSSGAANAASYGAFWNGVEQQQNPPQSPTIRQTSSFDRRNEIYNLTASMRPTGGSGMSSLGPHEGTSPLLTPINTIGKKPVPLSWIPSPTLLPSDPSFAVHTQRRESTRGRHMRQHSAQIYMNDIRGTKQMARCRNVIFFILFVFHLLFIVYVGNLYAKDALSTHTAQKGVVTIYYSNLIYIACLSGSFAVVVSSALLGAMTIFAEKFIQVALMVVITLSFMWGTIGVGLSAKNVVPVTGVIALALSVAYAFIVWDRIPFASANLHSALSAIRAYPGIVGVALIFQALALGWTIYFCVVVIGVVDAIREDHLHVTHRMAVFIYVMLGISYYWTFQVFLVSVSSEWEWNGDARFVSNP
jgi:hypothetical protein